MAQVLQEELDPDAPQFAMEVPPPPKVPWKTVGMALLLFTMGTTLLLMGTGTFFRTGVSAATPLLVLGSICFIPGSYYTFMFIQIFRGVPGYTYLDIPSYDD
ncbi:unnamed protein product [Vitrella brassicaformis CCMP3155]|uniref:Transmembrane protein 230 n=1 Tax=Vitrella brassicaformis (strain CCMP3155) TaxID=1169540 RepID=A0A0G4GEK2_VITBC|nr:unnamed protein product [Vitrella brassicaformis CCMP3155]|eukprot:CEM27808.1 unnamed protein product [Vitrella brassicaformis CCMP3155]